MIKNKKKKLDLKLKIFFAKNIKYDENLKKIVIHTQKIFFCTNKFYARARKNFVLEHEKKIFFSCSDSTKKTVLLCVFTSCKNDQKNSCSRTKNFVLEHELKKKRRRNIRRWRDPNLVPLASKVTTLPFNTETFLMEDFECCLYIKSDKNITILGLKQWHIGNFWRKIDCAHQLNKKNIKKYRNNLAQQKIFTLFY